jgi:hypothetical protein
MQQIKVLQDFCVSDTRRCRAFDPTHFRPENRYTLFLDVL